MKPALVFCFVCALEYVCANLFVLPEGQSLTVKCHFDLSGRKKFLCKNKCSTILIQTTGDRAHNGKYDIVYEEGSFLRTPSIVGVSIMHLTLQDSGDYMCGLERPYFPDSYSGFEIRVISRPQIVRRPAATVFKGVTFSGRTAGVERTSAGSVPAAEPVNSSVPMMMPLVVSLSAVAFCVFLALYRCHGRFGLSTRGRSVDRKTVFVTFEKNLKCPKSNVTDADPDDANGDEIYYNI